MWLPTPLYERAPHYWLLLGLLLCIVGFYLGLQIDRLYLFLAVASGAASCVWSFLLFLRRSPRRPGPDVEPDLDQTCELNYKPDNS